MLVTFHAIKSDVDRTLSKGVVLSHRRKVVRSRMIRVCKTPVVIFFAEFVMSIDEVRSQKVRGYKTLVRVCT